MILPGGMAAVYRPIMVLAACWFLGISGTGSCLAQLEHLPPGPPSGGPQPGLIPAQPAPVVIDTALVTLEFPAADQAPTAIHTVQDTVLFGGLFHLILDYPGQQDGLTEVRLAGAEEWLLLVPEEKSRFPAGILGKNALSAPDLSTLPDAGDRVRVVQTYRVYRTDPFRLRAGSFISPVIHVRGRVAGTDEIADIRAPRPGGWSLPWMLALLLLLFLVLWLGWFFWNRSHREDLTDRVLPSPAWLAAAVEMRDLMQEGFLNRGDSRAFLDGLAGIARRFVAGRFRIAAQEMTGREIITACADLGYRSSQPGGFARMIDGVDLCRYNPELADPGWCRDQAILLYDQIGIVRILPRYSEVSADLRREGEAAWADLKRELCSGPGRLQGPAAVSYGREA